jgi:hypothetical protein
MELTWKGYVISLRAPVWVQRKQAESASDPSVKGSSRSELLEQHRRESEKEYIMASGNRHVGPVR